MSDFFQNGVIATFHKLGKGDLKGLENKLKDFSNLRPIALILPALYREFTSGTLPQIMFELRKSRYLKEIVISLDKANLSQFKKVKNHFSNQKKVSIIWNDGPRMKKLYLLLDRNNLSAGNGGKGRAVWIALGYLLARRKCQVIALQDSDIVNYDRMLLGRLCYPVANPHSEYEFCKGFYSRVSDRLYGRVTRLFYTPFIRALEKMLGYLPFLVYMDSFRYALAGEIALRRDLAMAMRIPNDWGVEVGTLAEVYRRVALNRICQVDIADTYEHKHQELVPSDAEKGILKMAADIAKSIFRTLAGEGVQFSVGFFKTLSNLYSKIAHETIVRYENDAAINGLHFDRHAESVCVDAFTQAINIAGEAFWNNPFEILLIPNWHIVSGAIPDYFNLLVDTVRKDREL